MKQAQIISLDFVAGVLLFLLFIAAFVALTQTIQEEDVREEDEYLFAHINFEQNLQSTEHPFYENYRIDTEILNEFDATEYDINNLVFGDIQTQGIGLNPQGHRTCIEIINTTQQLHMFGNCAQVRNQCVNAISVTKPALYDTGNYQENQIVQVRIVACKE